MSRDPADHTRLLELWLEFLGLKDEARSGWVLRGVTNPESVADHSWGTALLALAFAADAGVDAAHAVKIALVHDLAEVRVGDVPRRVDPQAQTMTPQAKAAAEAAAMEDLAGHPATASFGQLWREYEDATSAEARFVRDMNLIDMCVQALYYQRNQRYRSTPETEREFPDYRALDEFFATSYPRLQTELGRVLFERVQTAYQAVRDR